LARRNLSLIKHARVERLSFQDQTATGVHFRRRASGNLEHVAARGSILVSAGTIGSPQLLMVSGIGPGEELLAHNIPVVKALAGVGRNLMDHLEVYFQQACTRPVSLNRWLNPFGKGLIGALWLLRRSGLGSTNHFEVGGFVRSRAGIPWPDIQFHFLPAAVSYDGTRRASKDGYQVHIGPMLSPSRGEVRLRSANTADKPILRFNYMSSDEDWRVFRSAIRLAREIFSQPTFDDYRGEELAPGSKIVNDRAIDEFVRSNAESAYHPCGTCRMGTDPEAVVDAECRVHGIDNLRVIDASVFPHITNGNLNAPTIMVAEKVADSILGQSLAPESQPYYADAQGESRQRPGH
ncbi:MAG: GMC oxidoreductase, partial [Pseudomonadales bacterium]